MKRYFIVIAYLLSTAMHAVTSRPRVLYPFGKKDRISVEINDRRIAGFTNHMNSDERGISANRVREHFGASQGVTLSYSHVLRLFRSARDFLRETPEYALLGIYIDQGSYPGNRLNMMVPVTINPFDGCSVSKIKSFIAGDCRFQGGEAVFTPRTVLTVDEVKSQICFPPGKVSDDNYAVNVPSFLGLLCALLSSKKPAACAPGKKGDRAKKRSEYFANEYSEGVLGYTKSGKPILDDEFFGYYSGDEGDDDYFDFDEFF